MGLKGELQKVKVIESASYCLVHFGERGMTFQAIAEHCKISQSSVVKYLKSRDNIFPVVLDYWINRARDITAAAIVPEQSPEEKLKAYLKVSHQVFFERNDVSISFLTLHALAGVDEKYRLLNSQIKEVAQNRVAGFIEEGIKDKSFKKVNTKLVAKTIHNSLMGYLLSSITETSKPSDLELPAFLEEMCLGLVRAKTES